MRADPQTEREIFIAVDAFLDHLAGCRSDEALACFLPDGDAALYGSEVSETIVGPTALRTFFEKLLSRATGPRFSLAQRRASIAGNVAWFTSEGEVQIGEMRVAPYRLSGVLEKRDGRWLWALFSGSEPLPDRG